MAFRRRKKSGLIVNGDTLIQDFLTVFNNIVLVENLKYIAEQNEETTVAGISSVLPRNGVYVEPGDIAPDLKEQLATASVNAHMQKAQAQQIEKFSMTQLRELEDSAKAKYVGRKVRVQLLNRVLNPVDTHWFDTLTGRYNVNQHSPRKIVGIITDIDLNSNSILLKPTMAARAVNKSVKQHRVYIINPTGLKPLVRIRFK
jgi:hypothetical protein